MTNFVDRFMDALFPSSGSGTSSMGSMTYQPEIAKATTYRFTAPEYFAVSGSDVINLGYDNPEVDPEEQDPDDVKPADHEEIEEYGLMMFRGSEIEYKAVGPDEAEAHSQAIDCITNNRNTVSRVCVTRKMPRTVGKKPVHCALATYASVSMSELLPTDIRLSDDTIPDILLKATETQSIIFPKDKFTVAEAKAWLNKHGKKSGKVDTTDQYHRFRQFDPSECSTTPKTIALGSGGIKAIICTRKTSKQTAAESIDAQLEKIVNDVTVIKSELSKGLVYGIVYSPNVVDAHGDYTSAEEIENAAHNFLPSALKSGTNGWTDINHSEDVLENSIEVVESYIAPVDFEFDSGEKVTKGSWVLVAKVNDPELKSSIEKGSITGFSLEGTAQKV